MVAARCLEEMCAIEPGEGEASESDARAQYVVPPGGKGLGDELCMSIWPGQRCVV
jgi:hypothetical protein